MVVNPGCDLDMGNWSVILVTKAGTQMEQRDPVKWTKAVPSKCGLGSLNRCIEEDLVTGPASHALTLNRSTYEWCFQATLCSTCPVEALAPS